jgi:hypothetical protein
MKNNDRNVNAFPSFRFIQYKEIFPWDINIFLTADDSVKIIFCSMLV